MARVSDEGQGWVFSSGSDTPRHGIRTKEGCFPRGHSGRAPLGAGNASPNCPPLQATGRFRPPRTEAPSGGASAARDLPSHRPPRVLDLQHPGRRARQGRPGRRRQSSSSRSASRPRAAPPGSGAALSSGRGRSEGLPRAVRALHFLPTRGLLDVQRRESDFFWLRRPLCPARVQVQTTRPGRHAELVVRGVSRPGAPVRAFPRVREAGVEAPRRRNLPGPGGSAAAPRWARRRGGGGASG